MSFVLSAPPTDVHAGGRPSTTPLSVTTRLNAERSYGQMPLAFEPNEGQAEAPVRFLARGQGFNLLLAPDEAMLILKTTTLAQVEKPKGGRRFKGTRAHVAPPDVVRLGFSGANGDVQFEGLEPLAGVSNYFIGKDPSRWHTHIRHYAKVRARGIYPGVDVIYYGNRGQLEYDLEVQPGADPGAIRVRYQGADRSEVDREGNLRLKVHGREIMFKAPQLYQEQAGGRRSVEGKYVPRTQGEFGFEIGAYDRAKPLVIDPVLDYSSYLGGTGSDTAYGIVADAGGNAYITGDTMAVWGWFVTPPVPLWTPTPIADDFPSTPGSFQPASPGQGDVFVTKMSPNGSTLIYSTYLGGSYGSETGSGIVVDGAGEAYVVGSTSSSDFPVTPGALQPSYAAPAVIVWPVWTPPTDLFLTKLNANGSALLYSTYLGGTGSDFGFGIALDGAGNAYLTGQGGPGFPTTAGAYQTTSPDNEPILVKIRPAGAGTSDLIYSTFLSTVATDPANSGGAGCGVVVDGTGAAYLTGYTAGNFPTTSGSFQPNFQGGSPLSTPGYDAFLAKMDPAGMGAAGLVYSTFLGGTDNDFGYGIALDALGNAFVTGSTGSTDLPASPGSYQPTAHFPGGGAYPLPRFQGMSGYLLYWGGLNGSEAFVMKLRPLGAGASDLDYCTYLGGDGSESGDAIAVDGCGNAYMTGSTTSSNFPTTPGAVQTNLASGAVTNSLVPWTMNFDDAFLSQLDPTGSTLLYSTYLGGSGSDTGYGLGLDPSGNVYVAGGTYPLPIYTICITCAYPISVSLNAGIPNAGAPTYPYPYPVYSPANDFPTTPGSFQAVYGGSGDAFAAKFNGFVYCTPSPTPTITATPSPTAVPNEFFVSKNLMVGNQDPVTIHVRTAEFPGAYCLRVYNSAGEHIKTLDEGSLTGPFEHTYTWDGTNLKGDPCASGVYILYWAQPFGVHRARLLLVR